MKVKHLLNILSKIDPEIDVGVLQDSGIHLARNVGLYTGEINVSNDKQTIWTIKNNKYVIIGNPGDFEEPAYYNHIKPIETYYINDAENIILYK